MPYVLCPPREIYIGWKESAEDALAYAGSRIAVRGAACVNAVRGGGTCVDLFDGEHYYGYLHPNALVGRQRFETYAVAAVSAENAVRETDGPLYILEIVEQQKPEKRFLYRPRGRTFLTREAAEANAARWAEKQGETCDVVEVTVVSTEKPKSTEKRLSEKIARMTDDQREWFLDLIDAFAHVHPGARFDRIGVENISEKSQ